MPRTPPPGTSLTDLYPNIATQWHPTLNNGLRPDDYTPGSGHRPWWQCAEGHQWQTSISNRARHGSGCRECNRSNPASVTATPRKPKPGRSLADIHPTVAHEWDPELNNGFSPADVTPSSAYRATWRADCGHTWTAAVSDRTRARHTSGCPECAKRGRRLTLGVNDLASQHPDLYAQLYPHLNPGIDLTTLHASSALQVTWTCPDCAHTWATHVSSRTSQRRGCPACSGKVVITGRNDLATTHPQIADQWAYRNPAGVGPESVSAGSHTKAWWTCATCEYEWETSVDARTAGRGCPACAGTVDAPGHNMLPDTHPEMVGELHPTRNDGFDPSQARPASHQIIWWQCPTCQHEWTKSISARTSGSPCPRCTRRRYTIPPGKSLADLHPQIAAEWVTAREDFAPDMVTPASHLMVTWQCSRCGEQWDTTILARMSAAAPGPYCRSCTKEVPEPGRSLADIHPSLANQWHPTLNNRATPTDTHPFSRVKRWWRCSSGHTWEASVLNRAYGSGCPDCTLWSTSRQEIRLAHEINTIIPLTWGPSTAVVQTPERTYRVDMLLEHHPVVIEFDGARWHSLPDSLRKDTYKTQALEAAGYTVIRVREPGLPPIGQHDIAGRGDRTFETTVLVLQRLAMLGVIRSEQADDYETGGR